MTAAPADREQERRDFPYFATLTEEIGRALTKAERSDEFVFLDDLTDPDEAIERQRKAVAATVQRHRSRTPQEIDRLFRVMVDLDPCLQERSEFCAEVARFFLGKIEREYNVNLLDRWRN